MTFKEDTNQVGSALELCPFCRNVINPGADVCGHCRANRRSSNAAAPVGCLTVLFGVGTVVGLMFFLGTEGDARAVAGFLTMGLLLWAAILGLIAKLLFRRRWYRRMD